MAERRHRGTTVCRSTVAEIDRQYNDRISQRAEVRSGVRAGVCDGRVSVRALYQALPIALMSWLALSLPLAAQTTAARVTPISGDSFEATSVTLDQEGNFLFDASPAQDWTSIRTIQWDRPVTTAEPLRWQIFLIGNCTVDASRVVMTDEAVQLDTVGGEIEIPIEQLVGIVHRPTAGTQTFEAAGVDEDRLVVKVEDGIQEVDGLLESVSVDGVEFEFEDAVRQIPWDRIVSVALASAGAGETNEGMRVELNDGSSWFGQPISIDQSSLQISLGPDHTLTIGTDKIVSLGITTDRILQLSSLEPVEQESLGLLLPSRAWQPNRSVAGERLELRAPGSSKSYEFGLGVPSGTTLTYELKDYDRFAAWIGIDPATRGRGDCEVVVRLDDKEVFRSRLQGPDAPLAIDLPLENAERLTLSVEFGEGLELGDHVNWCDARLVRVRD